MGEIKCRCDKLYYERYALLSVCYLHNLDIKNFEHSDKPDLQSKKYDVGIEVVRAITEHDGLTQRIINKYFGKGLTGDEIVEQINKNNTKSKFRGSVCSVDGVAVISSEKGLYDADKHLKLVVKKIDEKSQKSKNYRCYKTNGLYCFAQTGLIDENSYPIIIEACRKSAFSLIYIDCIDIVLEWNSPSDVFIVHEIPAEDLRKWSMAAQKQ